MYVYILCMHLCIYIVYACMHTQYVCMYIYQKYSHQMAHQIKTINFNDTYEINIIPSHLKFSPSQKSQADGWQIISRLFGLSRTECFQNVSGTRPRPSEAKKSSANWNIFWGVYPWGREKEQRNFLT